jgi:predicted RNA-binding Zn-ribbon protein involved in translation (DUF1610 family)
MGVIYMSKDREMTDPVIVLPCATCGARLEIPERVERLVCTHCGCEQVVYRSGGIIGLAPVMRADNTGCLGAYNLAVNQLQDQIRDLKIELEKLIHLERQEVPAYTLLRYDFLRLGKLTSWNVHYIDESELEKIFRGLSLAEIDKLIKIYQRNTHSPTAAWLLQVRDLRKQVLGLEQELQRLKSSAGMAEA